jgi:hypothetical protein
MTPFLSGRKDDGAANRGEGTTMKIDEAKEAVTQARENYKSAVLAYRDAIKPTEEEFAEAEPSTDNHEYHGGVSREDLLLNALDYEEGVLDQIVENREESDDEAQSATASGQ